MSSEKSIKNKLNQKINLSVPRVSKKVIVGMSGGVDSSVTAMLLRDAGHDVTGVFINTWQPDYIECTSKDDRLDAMRVCAQLDIKFLTLDLESEYKKYVIDYFLDEYKNNRTPNPDVMCNKYIKFGAFLDYALQNGADYIATGHYAKIENKTPPNPLFQKEGEYELFTSDDKNKDQSYFLYQIKKENLSKILFPLASLEKSEVRKIAKDNNLCTSDKKDSQGICMLGGDVSVKDFLIKELKPEKGDVCIRKNNENQNTPNPSFKKRGEYQLEKIGTHNGVILYTIGERHGFEIDNSKNKEPDQNNTPYFVIGKDLENNILIVSQNKPTQSNNKNDLDFNNNNKILLSEVNILIDRENKNNKEIFDSPVFARSRYRGELFKIKFDMQESSFEILERETKTPPAPLSKRGEKNTEDVKIINTICVSGQSLVMYDKNNRVLGGGVIA